MTVTEIVAARLRGSLLGLSLFGSAVMGGLRPDSDIDLFAVTDRQMTLETRARLVADIMDATRDDPPDTPLRPVEVTAVAIRDVRPWRYPPRMDFQYGEWLWDEFEQGELHLSGPREEPDLAILLTMARRCSSTLSGQSLTALTDPVPVTDLHTALVEVVDPLLADLADDTRNVVLTLARIWNALETGGIASKDGAADWTLDRLDSDEAVVLLAARDAYLGLASDDSSYASTSVDMHARRITAEIRRLQASS